MKDVFGCSTVFFTTTQWGHICKGVTFIFDLGKKKCVSHARDYKHLKVIGGQMCLYLILKIFANPLPDQADPYFLNLSI